MAKIGLTKLQLKKNTNLISLKWNDLVIEIKEYLPLEEKTFLIERIVNSSLDDNNFANPIRIKMNLILEMMYAYTNINFTEKQKEDKMALYDLLVSSGLWDAVEEKLNTTKDYTTIKKTISEVIDEVYKFKTSVLGVLTAVSQDYENLNLDATEIEKKIANKENVEFLKNVMDKLG